MQNVGSSLRWQETQMLLPRSTTMPPWLFIQPSGCGMSSPLWQSAQIVPLRWHP